MTEGIITPEMYQNLLNKVDSLNKENEQYKQRSPLVGVRFYGRGGIAIGLSHAVNGITRVVLEGYGDKAVIDTSAWVRMRGTEEVKGGILVRDDRVIEETGTVGVAAKPDLKENFNAYTDDEIEKILKLKSLVKLKQCMKKASYHFCPRHFRIVADDLNVGLEKLSIIKERERYLFSAHRWSLLHHHDLVDACSINNIRNYDDMSDSEMVDALINFEIEESKEK